MKILQIAANAPYNENWGYQENLLPKYQKKLGHEVILIVPNQKHENGHVVTTNCEDYINKDGIRVIRRSYKQYATKLMTCLYSRMDITDILDEFQPDFIFSHGLISTTIFEVIAYKKNHTECVIVQDNHQDYNIGYQTDTFKEKLVRSYFRHLNKKTIPYVDRVYGVTPWRQTYAEDYYGIPHEKTDVLIMGADDEKLDLEHRRQIRNRIRIQYSIGADEFLVVTGGKLDDQKMTDQLMLACKDLSRVRLLIFGKPEPAFKEKFEQLLKSNDKLIYVGWIDADQVYDYFFAADLVVFPGQHSVLWEQACASKTPCVFRRWIGMEHVNNGGNTAFMDDIRAQAIRKTILSLQFTPAYTKMKEIAESDATDIYLYSRIARKSIEMKEKRSI